MPLIFSKNGENYIIKTIIGKDDTRKFLEGLGFIVGAKLQVISQNSGNLIVIIKNTRIALDKSIASRVIV
jgi:ferrous iron transport protein A